MAQSSACVSDFASVFTGGALLPKDTRLSTKQPGREADPLRPKGRRIVSLGFAVWFCLAVAIGLAGGLRNAQPPMLPALIGTLGAALFVSWRVPLIIVTHILLFVRQAPALRDC
ncbi:MAG: hypothetical protein M3505_01110 [Verrucomicrobiota bacterium]|nr:hypothetical protein [Chthoniobacterales bacterium]MBA3762049.1 hypothetical protein [Chthoniobacterales bacterium]MDQ3313230.1 hypothetical protein [Verrucomicrobiota bacterium]